MRLVHLTVCACLSLMCGELCRTVVPAAEQREELFLGPIDVNIPHISTDKSVNYDYDIVYVRVPRKGDQVGSTWAEVGHPLHMDPCGDLMLLHPDGSEEVLVEGGDGSVADPMISFEGEWVYYARFHDLKSRGAPYGGLSYKGADIYKLHIKTRKEVKLTDQTYTVNTGAADWSKKFGGSDRGKDYVPQGVFNTGPCPLPGGKVMFTSSRNGFRPPKYAAATLQLFVMDDDGGNVEQIGHLNISQALHPVVLVDGRVMFSTFESQGLRSIDSWGIWTIHPDGTNWKPMVSAFELSGIGANSSFHFQSQLSDGSIIVERYYINNNFGMGSYFKFPLAPSEGYPAFGPADDRDPRNKPMRTGRHYNGVPMYDRLPFQPYGMQNLLPFMHGIEGAAGLSVLADPKSPEVGKVTHPSGAPDNHLLTVYSPGPVNSQNGLKLPSADGGLYLIKSGTPVEQPSEMLLIKNDPLFNEQWPRAVVSYRRIYGVDEPHRLPALRNEGKLSKHLPEGTPFGLVGSSSLYKRESYPLGSVLKDGVTAGYRGGDDVYQGLDPFNSEHNGVNYNWTHQGADAGRYTNEDIHAIRILAMEPTTDCIGTRSGRQFHSHANERLRVLGEFPVRKFNGDHEPLDPDGNPDTSFLAQIPADVAFTFQTLDKHGMVLNMAQTWHQVRPGEVRTDCGGCHAHSQQPTEFQDTAAGRPDYEVWDLTQRTPLLTTKQHDESNNQWDPDDQTGVRFEESVKNVEFYRDVKPILERSCVACHTQKWEQPAGNLVLDDDKPVVVQTNVLTVPSGTYARLATDGTANYGHKPIAKYGWRLTNASRYVRMFQARRSLLIWKVYGQRLDGWTNDDFPTETVPGDASTLQWKGKPVAADDYHRNIADLDFTGSIMPPSEAVAGTYEGPDGQRIKVTPLTDEDQRTLVRWIDLGCPIELLHDPSQPNARSYGWMCDDNRPTLTVTSPQAGANDAVTRILVGMHDYGSGLNDETFRVTADFEINGIKPGENLASQFKPTTQGVREWRLSQPLKQLERGNLIVEVADKQGNITRIERQFSITD